MLDRLVDLIVQFAELFKFWIIIEPYEAGVQTRLGKFTRVLTDAGFYWILPFHVDVVVTEHMVPTTHLLRDQSVTTSDGKQIAFQAIITYQIRDVKKCLLEVNSAENAIQDCCAGTIAHELSRLTYHDIVEVDETLEKVTAPCRKRGFKWGIEIMSVQFSTMTASRSLRLMITNHNSY